MSRKYRDQAPKRRSFGHPVVWIGVDDSQIWWLHVHSESGQSAVLCLGDKNKLPISQSVLESVKGLRFVPEIPV